MTEAVDGASAAPLLPPRIKLSQTVMRALLADIVSGKFPSGATLPSEPALCERYGVSRVTIREAVKALQEKGLVSVRQGSGTVVTDDEEWNLLDPLVLAASLDIDEHLQLADDIVGLRVSLEGPMARRAASMATPEQLATMGAIVAKMNTELDTPSAFQDSDIAFHDLIMKASGDRASRAVLRAIHIQARASARYHGHPTSAACKRANTQHRAIYNKIAAGDAEGAASAMVRHITDSWKVGRAERAHAD